MDGTVIDSLIVTLGLDGSNYKQGRSEAVAANKSLRDDAASTAKELSSRGKEAGEYFGAIKKEILGLFAVIAGGRGLEQLFTSSVNVSASIGRTASVIGTATEKLSGWMNLAKQAGASGDSMSGALTGIASNMEAAQYGPNAAVGFMQQNMGITLTGKNGQPRDPSDIMLDISHYFASHSGPQDMYAAQQIGIDPSLIPMLQQGVTATQLAGQGNVSDKTAKAAEDLYTAFSKLETQVDGFSNDIMTDIAPTLLEGMNNFTKGIWLIDQVLEGKQPVSVLTQGMAKALGLGQEAYHHGAPNAQSQAAVLQQGMSELVGHGLSTDQAAIVMGNLQAESSLDPTAVNPQSGAAGLGQWLGPRADAFKKQYGVSPDNATVAQQIDFLLKELTTTESSSGHKLLSYKNVRSGASDFGLSYERFQNGESPSDAAADLRKRSDNAARIAGAYQFYRFKNSGANSSGKNTISIGQIQFTGPVSNATQVATTIKDRLNSVLGGSATVNQSNYGLQ